MENEFNFFVIGLYNGIMLGFRWDKYPDEFRSEFTICLPFVQFIWVKQMVDDEEAERILNNEE
jgi:hypothetical protein